jgi:hypothetical protein
LASFAAASKAFFALSTSAFCIGISYENRCLLALLVRSRCRRRSCSDTSKVNTSGTSFSPTNRHSRGLLTSTFLDADAHSLSQQFTELPRGLYGFRHPDLNRPRAEIAGNPPGIGIGAGLRARSYCISVNGGTPLRLLYSALCRR